jgi:hypothetical protein
MYIFFEKIKPYDIYYGFLLESKFLRAGASFS